MNRDASDSLFFIKDNTTVNSQLSTVLNTQKIKYNTKQAVMLVIGMLLLGLSFLGVWLFQRKVLPKMKAD